VTDLSHLDAIDMRLSHERVRVSEARNAKEKEWREHNVRMIERERVQEVAFLVARGWVEPAPMALEDILSDEELLRELEA
jgi:hypothetical protein